MVQLFGSLEDGQSFKKHLVKSVRLILEPVYFTEHKCQKVQGFCHKTTEGSYSNNLLCSLNITIILLLQREESNFRTSEVLLILLIQLTEFPSLLFFRCKYHSAESLLFKRSAHKSQHSRTEQERALQFSEELEQDIQCNVPVTYTSDHWKGSCTGFPLSLKRKTSRCSLNFSCVQLQGF